ncbi:MULTISPECIES: PQQ-dependent sugar dehydrogenase [unclassified Aureimonas]|uniref:PQQ-dependent sugar dehydrogenase n=1 Tax=unclassified Aureimonas TaxID=2615206 RepID=UPI0006FD7A72|nr:MULTISPECIES: PQQ-dependent sugar dehydrogenase [unclassified Aureimonas]KQT64169.1 hypothetical protein ASG62_04010 [Aureimonas sp. Leaf427]KQT81358.1 hypothetical protein ASG54_01280 [Aureimonas sp. Leaf460]
MTKTILAVALGLASVSTSAFAYDETLESKSGPLQAKTFADDLDKPWAMEFLPDGSVIVTEKGGTMRLVSASGEVGEPIAGVPEVASGGQGGLLDVALDPGFAENRRLFFTWSEPGEGGNSTAAASAKLSVDGTSLEGVTKIFTQMPKYDGNKHFGSRIVFDGEGHIFIGLGERSDQPIRNRAKDLDNHLGKVVRLNLDGSVPSDNPFVNQAGAMPEIWSYGHRNIQGGARDPASGEIWFSEHGPKGGDEVNRIEKGANYGWAEVSYGVNYDGTPVGTGKETAEGVTDPVHHWTPVIGASGMAFYDADLVPSWKGSTFHGGLATENLVRLEMKGNAVAGEERFDLGQRIRDVKQGPDGALYVLAEDIGEIIRIAPAGAATSG